jgi:hypothetical protein
MLGINLCARLYAPGAFGGTGGAPGPFGALGGAPGAFGAAGAAFAAATISASVAPQLSHLVASIGFEAPQIGHFIWGFGSSAPHFLQFSFSGGLNAPHSGHFFIISSNDGGLKHMFVSNLSYLLQ